MHASEGPPDGIDVLIAEDDEPLRAGLRFLLEREGYACADVGDGRAAVALARRSPPRCVLLDLAMPGLDGIAVVRRLRSDPRTCDTHIHCLTGRQDPEARRQALEAGCEHFLTKPVDADTLLDILRAQVPPAGVRQVTGLTMFEAEELLDQLEANGVPQPELSCDEQQGSFSVRWRDGPAQAPSAS
jgi:CheY-like chemotaxis protein